MLTKTHINKIKEALKNGTGVDIKISKTQTRKAAKKGGSLFSAIIPLARSIAPTLAETLGLSALAGLASEGASQVMKAISGSGHQTGSFLIPQDKVDKLIAHKNLLASKQRQDILNALQTGGQLVVKPTKTQQGGFLSTLLASVRVPLL